MKQLSRILLTAFCLIAGASLSVVHLSGKAEQGVVADAERLRPLAPSSGPICSEFTNRTDSHGLGDVQVNSVHASGSTLYAATENGLSLSSDNGASFVNRTPSDGLSYAIVQDVYASGSTIYAATAEGLSISTDGGTTFTSRTTVDGLGSNDLNAVHANGSTIYVASMNGLSISTDGGSSFTTALTNSGLGSNSVLGVHASSGAIRAATTRGVSISSDGGATFANRTTTDGLGDNWVYDVFGAGNRVYAATYGGLSISTDGGATFVNRTTVDGLGSDIVLGIYASGNTVYAATQDGLSISTDGGLSFTNVTTLHGLGSRVVYDVYALGNTVYAATNGGLSFCTATATIAVSGNGVPIAAGDASPAPADGTDFGAAEMLSGSVVHTFTIRNTGATGVIINGVAASGEHENDFSVVDYPGTTLSPGVTTTFQVAFSPLAAGLRTATLSIASNDTAQNPYTFAVQGEGLPVQNEAPTDIALSNNSVNENEPPGTAVGTFTTTDADAGDSHVYTLVDGATDAFAVTEDLLHTAAIFDFEAQQSYTLTVRSTDSGGLAVEKVFAIAVGDTEERPVAVDDPTEFPPGDPWVVVGDGIGVPMDVLSNDFSPLGTPLRVSTVSSPTILGGQAVNATTAVNYTAPAAVNGTDSFLYTNSDGASQSNGAAATIHVVANDDRGDCNGDKGVDSSDPAAIMAEMFDRDDSPAWWRTFTGSYAGSPRGCDANGLENGISGDDASVDVSDTICAVLLAAGAPGCPPIDPPGAAAPGDAAATKPARLLRVAHSAQIAPPALSMGTVEGAVNSPVRVPVALETNGQDIAGLAFSVDFDESCLLFDPTDGDGDGVPDAVNFTLPDAFSGSILFDGADADGEIDVMIADLAAPVDALPGTSEILTIDLTPSCAPPAGGSTTASVNFGVFPTASFSDPTGLPVTGTTIDGAVTIVEPTVLPTETPTVMPPETPPASTTPPPAGTPVPTVTNTPVPTPTPTGLVPTAITLVRFRAIAQPGRVLLQWETSFEQDVLSFSVMRSAVDAAGHPTAFQRIGENVPGRGIGGGVYAVGDATVASGQTYAYRLVARMADGAQTPLGELQIRFTDPAAAIYLPVIR